MTDANIFSHPINYYLTRDVCELVYKANNGRFEYKLINYDSLDQQKSIKFVAKLPLSKPKYLLINYD